MIIPGLTVRSQPAFVVGFADGCAVWAHLNFLPEPHGRIVVV